MCLLMPKVSLLSKTETLHLADISPPCFSAQNNADDFDIGHLPIALSTSTQGSHHPLPKLGQSNHLPQVWHQSLVPDLIPESWIAALLENGFQTTLKDDIMPGPAQRASQPHCQVNVSWIFLALTLQQCCQEQLLSCSSNCQWLRLTVWLSYWLRLTVYINKKNKQVFK